MTAQTTTGITFDTQSADNDQWTPVMCARVSDNESWWEAAMLYVNDNGDYATATDSGDPETGFGDLGLTITPATTPLPFTRVFVTDLVDAAARHGVPVDRDDLMTHAALAVAHVKDAADAGTLTVGVPGEPVAHALTWENGDGTAHVYRIA